MDAKSFPLQQFSNNFWSKVIEG